MTDSPQIYQGKASGSIVGSSLGEGIAGIAAVAVAVIGLVNVFPAVLVSVATISIGVALLFEGGTTAARFSELMPEVEGRTDNFVRWGGMSAGFLAGAAGIALGILSLLGVAPLVLVPIAAIAFGSALVMDSGVNARLAALEIAKSGAEKTTETMIRESATASMSIQVLVGLAAISLGILALVGLAPMVLSLVAMLSIGFENLVTGTLVGGRLATIFR
jgi:hypothetical protein